MPATVFDKAIYRLHPSFGDRAVQSMFPLAFTAHDSRYGAVLCQVSPSSDRQWLTTQTTTAFKKPPFRIHEEGWGEFDMTIDLVADKTHQIKHDLNFSQERYEAKHQIVSSFVVCWRLGSKLIRMCVRPSVTPSPLFWLRCVSLALSLEMRMASSPSAVPLVKRAPRRRSVLRRM